MTVRGGPLLSAAAPELTCKPSDMRAATPFRHHTVVGTRCREQCLSPVRSRAYCAPSAEYDRYSTSDRPGNCQTRYAAKAVRSPRLSATCSKCLVRTPSPFVHLANRCRPERSSLRATLIRTNSPHPRAPVLQSALRQCGENRQIFPKFSGLHCMP